MTTVEALLALTGILLTVIGYFLIKTMNELDTVKKESAENKLNLAVLKNDHDSKHSSVMDKMSMIINSLDKLVVKLDKYIEKGAHD
jgi:hypothetical protein